MRPKDLVQKLEDHPFRAFRVHLTDGTVLPVTEPRMIIVSDNTAIIPGEFGEDEDGTRVALRWRTVDLLHIDQFSAINGRGSGRRRRKS